jgi:CHAT domain-containing protein/tetratricopeptide (TPR) repeat protein
MMENADFIKRYVEIIDSGADLATMEAEFARMAVDMGFPPDLAPRWASLLMEHGRDQERFALEQTKLLTTYAAEQLAAEDDSPEGDGLAWLMPDLQRVMERIHGAGSLIDTGDYTAGIEAADSALAAIADMQARAAALPAEGTEANPFSEDSADNPLRAIRAQVDGIIGVALVKLGQFADAMTRLDSAIAVLEPIAERAQATVPKLLMARSSLANAVGDLHGAIRFGERAVEARMREIAAATGEDATLAARITDSDLDLANLHDTVGVLCLEAGDVQRAIAFQERALTAYGQVGAGGVNTRTGLSIARCLQNRAMAIQLAGATADEVVAVLTSALGVYEAHQQESHPECIGCLENLATIQWLAGNIPEAATVLNRAAEALAKHPQPDPNIGARLMYIFGRVMAGGGLSDQAREAFQTSCELQGEVILRVLPAASEAQRLRFLEGIRRHLDALLSLVVQRFRDATPIVADVLTLVLQRKGLVADASAAQRHAVLAAHNETLTSVLEEMLSLERRIADLAARAPSDGDYDGHAAMLAGLRAEHDKLEIALASRIPQIAFERRLFAADTSTIAQALPEGSALVEFVRYRNIQFDANIAQGEPESTGDRYAAFVLPAGRVESIAVIDLGDAESIDALIGAWRSELIAEENDEDEDSRHGAPLPTVEGLRESLRNGHRRLRSAVSQDIGTAQPVHGQALRERVFDPCLPALGDCQRLIVAPDSEIARVPFESLPIHDAGHVIDRFEISYVPTGRSVLRFRTPGDDPPVAALASGALVVADPDYDFGGSKMRGFTSDEPFARLPATRDEGARIAKSLGVSVITDAEAAKPRFTDKPLPAIVHVATHGFFEPAPAPGSPVAWSLQLLGTGGFGPATGAGVPDNPMLRSGLVLAGANAWIQGRKPGRGTDTGIVTAADVAGLDLFETELVVLSACETGLGDVRAGDGVYGLRRAFSVAGARTLVMSLWQVPDEQTCELMDGFYQRLKAGRPVAMALREAQLSLKTAWPDPFYWGAFVCEGDPGLAIPSATDSARNTNR